MTIEELKNMIDSTINENGTKAITGKALNLALNEITNAVAEAATTGGGGVKRLYINMDNSPITDEQQLASNAALYTEIVTAFTNGELPPQVGVSIALGGGAYQCITNVQTTYDSNVILAFMSDGTPASLILTSDGNVSIG